MIKKLTLMLAVAGAAVFAQAGTLYWQIADKGQFSLATLWVDTGTEKSEIESALAEGVNGSTVLTGTTTGLVQTDISAYENDAYSFFVELLTYASDGTVQKEDWLNQYNYRDLVSNGYISSGAVGEPGYGGPGRVINMNAGGGAIPEPTSGMLLLLGGAVMALRRRRR